MLSVNKVISDVTVRVECHKLSKTKAGGIVTEPGEIDVGESGGGLEGEKNEGKVSLSKFVVLVDRGVNFGWMVKTLKKLVE